MQAVGQPCAWTQFHHYGKKENGPRWTASHPGLSVQSLHSISTFMCSQFREEMENNQILTNYGKYHEDKV